jgi:enterochelin esterase-like enzyme
MGMAGSQYDAHPRLPIMFFVETGRLEDVSIDGPTLPAANRHLVSVLRNKGYLITFEEVGGTHEPAHWRGDFAEGLTSVV